MPGKGVRELTVFLCEALVTALLLLVVMATATDDRAETPAVGPWAGLTVGGLILCTANVTSTSLNPIRGLVPMLVSGYSPNWPATWADRCSGAWSALCSTSTPSGPAAHPSPRVLWRKIRPASDEHPRGRV